MLAVYVSVFLGIATTGLDSLPPMSGKSGQCALLLKKWKFKIYPKDQSKPSFEVVIEADGESAALSTAQGTYPKSQFDIYPQGEVKRVG